MDDLEVEISLLPLLKREIKIKSIKARYGDAQVSINEQGTINALAPLVSDPQSTSAVWKVGVEDVHIADGRVRFHNTVTNTRWDISPLTFRAQATDISGPWRIHGLVRTIPVDVVMGFSDLKKGMPVKGIAGGGDVPRLEFEGFVGTKTGQERLNGKLKIQMGPPVQPSDTAWAIPTTFSADIAFLEEQPSQLSIRDIQIEAGEGTTALRASGQGRLEFAPTPHLNLEIEAARLDMDAFWLSPAGTVFANMLVRIKDEDKKGSPSPVTDPSSFPFTTQISVRAKQIWVAGEPLEQAHITLGGKEKGIFLTHLEAALPGGGTARFEKNVSTAYEGNADTNAHQDGDMTGKLTLNSQTPAKLANWLRPFHIATGWLDLARDAPLSVIAKLHWNPDGWSVPSFRWETQTSQITGALEATSQGSQDTRPTVRASVQATGFDLKSLPAAPILLHGLSKADLDLDLNADHIRFGNALTQADTGQLHARIKSSQNGLSVEKLSVENLASLDATLMGQITYGQTGNLRGQVKADRLAPLMVLLAKVTGSEHVLDWIPTAVSDAPLSGTLILTAHPSQEKIAREWQASNGSSNGSGGTVVPLDIAFEGASKDVSVTGQTRLLWG
jgi:hypothetical protein